jgi:hypothetical protein
VLIGRSKWGMAVLCVLAALLIAGCSDDSGSSTSSSTPSTESTATTGASGESDATPQEPATDAQAGEAANTADVQGAPLDKAAPQPAAPDQSVEDAPKADIYFTAGEQFQPVERKVPNSDAPIDFAIRSVVDGPTPQEAKQGAGAQTQIPAGTTVEGIELDSGTAKVDLSPQFLGDIPADPDQRSDAQEASLDARLGQITYTLTAFKGVDATEVTSGGVAVTADQKRGDYRKPSGGPPKVTHAKGSKSSGTRGVQEALANLKYLPKSAVDGVDGYRTQQAVIAFQAWEGLGRDGVAGPLTKAALRTAKRPKPRKRGPGKRIEVYRDKGVILLVRKGKLKRAIHVSSGAPGYTTPSGSYSVFRKEIKSWSVPFSTWLPYASYFNQGIAFHEYPDVPAYPASHGCVRVPSPEAKFVYRYAKIGIAVIVY